MSLGARLGFEHGRLVGKLVNAGNEKGFKNAAHHKRLRQAVDHDSHKQCFHSRVGEKLLHLGVRSDGRKRTAACPSAVFNFLADEIGQFEPLQVAGRFSSAHADCSPFGDTQLLTR